MDTIRHWRRGKTTIVITHDILQILPDDYAYLLENGRVVQDGYRTTWTRSKARLSKKVHVTKFAS
jgi:ABC-type bacteriocin/lantibiotic exporter with double-glycine peptidase domain